MPARLFLSEAVVPAFRPALLLCTQAIFAVIYSQLDPETFSFGSAFYLCIVTATTVGYGDVGVSDDEGKRLFASVHILYSVSSLAALLNTVTVLSSERKIQVGPPPCFHQAAPAPTQPQPQP